MEHSITCRNCKTNFLNKLYKEHEELCIKNSKEAQISVMSQPIRPTDQDIAHEIPSDKAASNLNSIEYF
jgi:hypothetical protein